MNRLLRAKMKRVKMFVRIIRKIERAEIRGKLKRAMREMRTKMVDNKDDEVVLLNKS